MELIGEEKKIQDLFHELKVEDARFAPRFTAVWNRAQARVNRPSRLFKLAFAAATVLLAFALFSLPWWSKRWPSTQQPSGVAVAPPAPNANPLPTVKSTEPKNVIANNERSPGPKPHSVNLMARREAVAKAERETAIREATAISKWQSPTTTLLSSSNDEVFTSLPQLNENANELKSFLPGRNN